MLKWDKHLKNKLGWIRKFSQTRNYPDVIITGLPRSGTTLTCYLLNKLPNTIALHEPMYKPHFKNPSSTLRHIPVFFKRSRKSLLKDRRATARHIHGEIPDNQYENVEKGNRKMLAQRGNVRFDKKLSQDFLLAMKHCGQFTAILPELKKMYPCYGIIRNPLAVLASWNSINAPVSRGNLLIARRFDMRLYRKLSQTEDLFDRQILVLSWFFDKYDRILPPEHIIRYEDIVSSGGRSLGVVTPPAENLAEELENKNMNTLYDFEKMKVLGEKLLTTGGPYWNFYTKRSVESLLEEIVNV